jgi:hypothetical protein
MIIDKNALLLEPRDVYDSAIINTTKEGVAVYSMEKVIECGIKEHGTYDESLEWHDYNTFSCYMGKWTPKFVSEVEDEY